MSVHSRVASDSWNQDPARRKARQMLQSAAVWLVTTAVVISPWLFASAEPWAYIALGFLVLAGAMCWLISRVAYPQSRLAAPGLTALLFALVIYMGIQIVPMPALLARIISPQTGPMVTESNALLASVVEARTGMPAGSVPAQTISVSPQATKTSIFVFGLCLLAFLVMANCLGHWHDIRRVASVIVGFGFLLMIVSIVQKMSNSTELLWINTPRQMEHGFGPFANRNHFATYITLIFGMVLGLFAASNGFREFMEGVDWRERLAWLSTKSASGLALLGLVLVLATVTIFLTLSRGGIVSFLASMSAAGFVLVIRGRSRLRGGIIAVACVAAAAVVWVGWDPIVDRMGTLVAIARDPASEFRVMASQDTVVLFGLNPLFGCGFGAFKSIFPLVARPELHFSYWVHAHNDWLEWLAEGGVVGGFLVSLVGAFFLKLLFTGLPLVRIGKRRFVEGCLVGLLAVGIHEAVDFGLRKASDGLLFAVVIGLVVAAMRRPWKSGHDGTGENRQVELHFEHEHLGPSAKFRARVFACALLIIVATVFGSSFPCFWKSLGMKRFEYLDRQYAKVKDPVMKDAVVSAAREEIMASIGSGLCRSEDLSAVMVSMFRWSIDRDLGPTMSGIVKADNVLLAERAARESPLSYDSWLWLARAEAAAGQWEEAEACLVRAARLRPLGDQPTLLPGPKK